MAKQQLSFGQMLAQWRGENLAFDLSPYRAVAAEVTERAESLANRSDQQLSEDAVELRQRVRARQGELVALDEALVETYALVYEAARRALGLTAFEEQLIAAVILHQGKVAEMRTGEGKTLVAVFAATLAGLGGWGAQILTTNDYLARRDATWMGPIYSRLGLRVGLIQQGMSPRERQEAYSAAVTYATANELGFDLLRDDLATSVDKIVIRRGLHYAIFDDIDSTLIDEARHSLVVAGDVPAEKDDLARINQTVAGLKRDEHYQLDEHGERVYLTDAGSLEIERLLEIEDLYAQENLELLTQVNLSIHAYGVLTRDVDYLVRQGKVELIDEHKGRVAKDRRLPEGLQGALEEKEGLQRSASSRVLASTTLQSVARRYRRLAGMTGTAQSDAEELGALYKLQVVVIPPHVTPQRQDFVDLIFTHGEARETAVAAEVVETHETGRPVLVGTTSVDESERLAKALEAQGVTCQVLNARNDEAEAEIIAGAGALGAVTISTSMAGRGTDIRLGGRDETDREEVAELGGLCVIGTRKHESERIDNQLRGRAGRQGDPGSTQIFVALDDDLFERYGVQELLPAQLQGARLDEPLLDHKVQREVDRAQRIMAARNASIRKTLYSYDSFIEGQRRVAQHRRRMMLMGREPGMLADEAPERWEELTAKLGEETVIQVERRLTVAWIDRAWSDHLARLAVLREDMQLMSVGISIGSTFGRERPQQTFQRMARESFETFEEDVDTGIVETFERTKITRRGIDLEAEGLAPPSETWTYVVKEQPLETKPRPRLQATLLKKFVDFFRSKKPAHQEG